LVELLVVIAIIGILVALLLPAVQSAREAARRAQCLNSLRQLALAIHNYADANQGVLPPGGVTDGPCCGTPSGTSWSISILPFIEEQALFDRYRFDKFNEDPENAYVREQHVATYSCPSDEDTEGFGVPESGPASGGILYARGSYRANTGRCLAEPEGWWDSPSQTDTMPLNWKGPLHSVGREYPAVTDSPRLGSVIDGLSNTLFVGESMTAPSSESSLRRRTFWAYSYTSYNKSCVVPQTRTLLTDYQRCVDVGGPGGSNPCKRAWGSFHPGGLQFAYGDGSVRAVSFSIDMEIFASLSTHAGGEIPLYQ
jgi:prepilin-type processing-associated H-X9-DG protein